jgi:hypothetical protein
MHFLRPLKMRGLHGIEFFAFRQVPGNGEDLAELFCGHRCWT